MPVTSERMATGKPGGVARDLVPPPPRPRARAAVPRQWQRRLTAPLRALPDILVIGAMKAGSTSLYNYVAAHPQVVKGALKEPHYFDKRAERSLYFYRRYFPLALPLRLRGQITLEATPGYLYVPQAPRLIRERLGRRGFVAVLRDPVERAISHHRHLMRYRRDRRPLEWFLDAAPERDEGYVFDPADPAGWAYAPATEDLVAKGIYDVQLRRWFETFDADAVKVVLLEELQMRPDEIMAEVFDFLGLPAMRTGAGEVHNRGYEYPVDPATRAGLAARFAPANARLEALLGRRLPWQ